MGSLTRRERARGERVVPKMPLSVTIQPRSTPPTPTATLVPTETAIPTATETAECLAQAAEVASVGRRQSRNPPTRSVTVTHSRSACQSVARELHRVDTSRENGRV